LLIIDLKIQNYLKNVIKELKKEKEVVRERKIEIIFIREFKRRGIRRVE